MFSILETAGVYPVDVARLLSVSRVAVSMWVNGHSVPSKMIERRVERLLAAIRSAVKAGDLPISPDVPRKNRHAEVAKVIRRHAERLQLGPIGD